MSKRKLKLFLKVFFLLGTIQFVIVLGDILLRNADSSLSEITSILISIISIPLSLVSSLLPFYSGEGILVSLLFWALNLTIQTIIIYGFIRFSKRIKLFEYNKQ